MVLAFPTKKSKCREQANGPRVIVRGEEREVKWAHGGREEKDDGGEEAR